MIGIGFSTTDGMISRVIRAFGREPGLSVRDTPSHVWILHDAYGRDCVMSEEWTGFGVVTYDWFRRQNRVIEVVPVNEPLARLGIDARARVDAAANFLGDGYDFVELFGHVLHCLRRFKSPRRMICQEAVLRFFSVLFPADMTLWNTTPARMMRSLRARAMNLGGEPK